MSDSEMKKSGFMAMENKNKIIGLIALACVIIVVAVIVLWRVFGADSGSTDVQYGVPVDYDQEGYITLGDYKGITVSVAVSDEDVQEEIDYIVEEAEIYEKKEGTAASGNMVNISYDATLDGKAVEDESASDTIITLGDEEIFDEFDQGIVGMKTGETKTVDVVIPDDYGDDMLDGKTVQYAITLNYICGNAVKADITDEFVKDYTDGECLSAIEFNDYIRNQLYDANIENIADDAWAKVIENTEVKKYHKGELDKAISETESSYESFAEFSGYDSKEDLLEDYGMTQEDVDEIGQEMAREKMVAKTIAAKENLTFSDDEYKNMLIEYMEYEDESDKNSSLEDIEKDYQESYNENPRDGMLLEYVKRFVADNANVEGKK